MLLAISLSLVNKVGHMANLFQYLIVREIIMKTKLVFYIQKNQNQKLLVHFTKN